MLKILIRITAHRERGENMKIHEYQGKEILKKFGVPVPIGKVAFNVEDAGRAAETTA